jgi:hypothetical protein
MVLRDIDIKGLLLAVLITGCFEVILYYGSQWVGDMISVIV